MSVCQLIYLEIAAISTNKGDIWPEHNKIRTIFSYILTFIIQQSFVAEILINHSLEMLIEAICAIAYNNKYKHQITFYCLVSIGHKMF